MGAERDSLSQFVIGACAPSARATKTRSCKSRAFVGAIGKKCCDELSRSNRAEAIRREICRAASFRPADFWQAPRPLKPNQFGEKKAEASKTAFGSRFEGKSSQNPMTRAQLIIQGKRSIK